jgi:phosphate transport system protein
MPNHDHISKQFDTELESIRASVLQMGGLVESQIKSAVESLVNSDVNLMNRVIEDDHRVNAMEVKIDEACSQMIARRQPTAGDLRLIMTVVKTITDLERIGDEATKIARAAKTIQERGGSNINQYETVRVIASSAGDMLHDALDAFARLDEKHATRLIAQDQLIDHEFRSIMRNLITFMMEDPRTISAALDTLWVAKAIERIGDHAKNIAEYVIFVVEGKDIRHTDYATAKLDQPG